MPKKLKLLIIGNPHNNLSAKTFLDKFIRIVDRLSNEIFVISGDKPNNNQIKWIRISNIKLAKNPLKILFYFISAQLKILKAITIINSYNIVIMFTTLFFIPALFLKLKGKKIVLMVTGVPKQRFLRFLGRINFIIADLLVVESYHVINEWNIGKYENKIFFGSIYVDTDLFKMTNNIGDRYQIVGYVGRLSKDKGIIEFIEAIKLLNNLKTRFLIVGGGECQQKVENFVNELESVLMEGWINNDQIPSLLNQMKILVIPSHSEGVPNIVLEAMACGTPVLASKVGGMPDIIKDHVNGFLIKKNTPESIAIDIEEILNYQHLNEISEGALQTIDERFTFSKAVKRWEKILRVINEK